MLKECYLPVFICSFLVGCEATISNEDYPTDEIHAEFRLNSTGNNLYSVEGNIGEDEFDYGGLKNANGDYFVVSSSGNEVQLSETGDAFTTIYKGEITALPDEDILISYYRKSHEDAPNSKTTAPRDFSIVQSHSGTIDIFQEVSVSWSTLPGIEEANTVVIETDCLMNNDEVKSHSTKSFMGTEASSVEFSISDFNDTYDLNSIDSCDARIIITSAIPGSLDSIFAGGFISARQIRTANFRFERL